MGSGNPGDLTVFKQQVVQVFTSGGTFIDVWRDAPLLTGFKETINGGITSLVVTLPRFFDNFDLLNMPNSRGTVAQGNIVKYFLFGPGLPNTGKLRYQGIIDKWEPSVANPEEKVDVTLTPYSNVLGDRGVTTSVTFGTPNNSATYIDPVTMFNWFFSHNDAITGVPYCNPLFLDGSNPASSGRLSQYTFTNQSILSVFQTILLMLPPNWFFRINPNRSVTLNAAPTTAQHLLYLGQHLTNAKYSQDYTQLQNDVYLAGKAPVFSRKTGTDIATFGQRLLMKSDSRITDTTTCGTVAQGLLTYYDQPVFRSPLRIFDYRGDNNTGLGYDIETIEVGDTVQLVDATASTFTSLWDQMQWDVSNWDFANNQPFNTVAQITELTYNFDSIDIALGLPRPNQGSAIFNLQRIFQDYTLGS